MTHMNRPFRRNDEDDTYTAVRELTDHDIVDMAKDLIEARFKPGTEIRNPGDANEYLASQLGDAEEEIFACLFLDNRHRILSFEKLFFGTIDGTSVYPRVVVKRTLALNAAAVILAHNHPSGINYLIITEQLIDAG